MSKTAQFQTIYFSLSTQFSSILPIDCTLLGSTNPRLSGPGSEGNERVLHIPQSSSITETSLSECLVHIQYTCCVCVWGVLPLGRETVGVFYNPSQLGNLYQ